MSQTPTGRHRPHTGLRARAGGIVAAAAVVATALSGAAATAAPSALTLAPRAQALSLLGAPIGFSDIDTRTSSVAPSASQVSSAAALGTVRWNKFGTPQTLINYGGFLGTGTGSDAKSVARSWLSSHASLFKLTTADVAALPVRVNPMAEAKGYSVSFTQAWNGVQSVLDGAITMGVKGKQIAIVTSSSAGSQADPAASTLSATAAWLAAATNVGRPVVAASLGTPKVLANGWTSFSAAGFAQPQYVRPVVIPIPGAGVRSGYEALVIDVQGGRSLAYSSTIDGITGDVIMRSNRVDQSEQQMVVNAAFTDTTCGAPVPGGTVDAMTKQIIVSMSATVASNDIVVKLLKDNTVVASEDTGVGTEALTYAPAAGVPAGDYFVQICPAVGAATPFVAPYTATGAFIATNTAAAGGTGGTNSGIPYPPTWKYFTNAPNFDFSSTDTRITGCWTQVAGTACTRKEQNLASRAPWDVDVSSGLPTFTTIGNNAQTAEAFTNPLAPGATSTRPVHPDRTYQDAWTNGWNVNKCNPTTITPGPTNGTDINAAITNLFVGHNRFHDFSYFLGFTEDNYNAQTNQFGNVSAGTSALTPDPEIGNVQAGALDGGAPSYMGRDNANQIALPDGVPSITNQYLFQPIAGAFYAPCSDGDMDTSIFGHEYTHLISNRMVGGPMSNLTGAQAGSMGESWSDLDALEYMHAFGYSPQAGENDWAEGVYATGNKTKGIRDYALNNNPLNYSDIGFDTTGAEVHADGEVWNAVNYDIRQALVTKYQSKYPATDKTLQLRCAQGEIPSDLCPGNRRWIQMVYDGWLLQPASDSMLDARDSYLAADVMRYGGANQDALWSAFAKRGFGVTASTVGTDDTDPIPSFVAKTGSKASTVNFTIGIYDTGKPVVGSGVKVYVGDYERGVTPVATSDASGVASVTMEPGTYHFVFQRAGIGLTKIAVTVPAGSTLNRPVHVVANLASSANGATAAESLNSTNAAALIDDTEGTSWNDTNPTTAVAVNTSNPAVTIKLGNLGTAVSRIVRSVRVSAYLQPAQSRFEALRKFRLDACVVSSLDPTCSLPTSFHPVYTSADDAFPAVNPRPVAPDLTSRTFDVPDFAATYVKLVALQNQCTGAPGYQGDQDLDPTNNSDCVTGSGSVATSDLNILGGAHGNTVRAAEFEAFGSDLSTRPPYDPVVPVTVSAPTTVQKGQNLTYSIGYTNLGPAASDHALLTDRLPAGLTFVSAPGATYSAANRTVTWSLGSVPVNASATETLVVKVTAPVGTGITNQADFAGDLTTEIPGAAYTLVTG